MISKVIEKLQEAIFLECSDEKIEGYEDIIVDYIEETINNPSFFNLPTDSILRIIKKSEITDIQLICSIVKSMSAYKKEDAPLLLNVIDSDEGYLQDYISIISSFECCPICKRISDIENRSKNLPIIDYPKMVRDLELKLSLLQNKLDKETKKKKSKPKSLEKPPFFVDNIFKAVENGNIPSISYHLENGADLKQVNAKGDTLLQHAVINGHIKVVKYLIDCGVNINEKNEYGETALYKASLKKNLAMVKTLIENGADVDMANNDGVTPIFQAAALGNLKMVKLLVSNKANYKLRDNKGYNIMKYITDNKVLSYIKSLN